MSNDLEKVLPKCDEGLKLLTPIFTNKISSNRNILESYDKKILHHPVDSTPRNKNIIDYMDNVCNFVMEKLRDYQKVQLLLYQFLLEKLQGTETSQRWR